MSYLVLARKYRPQRFGDLIGQEHVARTLTNAIASGRVHHAFLFTGARGVGKTSAARILAKALCCASGPIPEPCGTCDFCVEIASGQAVDVFEIDAASNTQVDKIRELLEGVRYLPARTRKKIYIVDEVHMLSASSFNALLKTLEEPPAHVVFVLATTEVHKIPATILSRCQRYDFKLIPTARLEQHLGGILRAEAIDVEPDASRLVARQAAGSVRDALSLLDQVIAYVGKERITAARIAEILGIADRRLLVDLAGAVLGRDAAAALRLLGGAGDRGVDLTQLARAFLAFVRDLEVVSLVEEPGDLVDATADELGETRALAGRAAAGLPGVLFDRWARAVDEAGKSLSPRLVYEMALCDLCRAEPLVPLGDLLERLEDIERRAAGKGGAIKAAAGSASVIAPPVVAPAALASPPPPGARPAPPSAAPPSPGAAPASGPAAVASDPAAAWATVLADLEAKRPRLGGLLAHAEVGRVSEGTVALVFDDAFAAEQAGKLRGEIEQALGAALGRPIGLEIATGKSAAPPVVRSKATIDGEQLAADRRAREAEAREHPKIRKAQDLFGASIREIKT